MQLWAVLKPKLLALINTKAGKDPNSEEDNAQCNDVDTQCTGNNYCSSKDILIWCLIAALALSVGIIAYLGLKVIRNVKTSYVMGLEQVEGTRL